MTREGDNETSAKAACRNAGYASFELEGMLDTTYMILGIRIDALLRGTWNLPWPGVERNTAEELQRYGGVTIVQSSIYALHTIMPPTYFRR